MRVVLAPDSFKESIAASAICEVMTPAFRQHGHEVVAAPIADGGEGTVDAVLAAVEGERVVLDVEGPLGEPVRAAYALVDDGRTAVIEMAAASGLQLVPEDRRNPMRASTFGTGQVIRHALARGVSKVIVALGGSATTDAGAGAAQALGVALLGEDRETIGRGGEALLSLSRIDTRSRASEFERVELIAACDVTNPLVGAKGSAHVYGPQKGADPEHVKILDRALERFAEIAERDTGISTAAMPGAGAAGGFAAGLVALCGGRIESGFGTVAAVVNLEEKIRNAEAVVTGEGRYDEQSAQGKAVSGVCELARKCGKPVHLVAGIVQKVPDNVFASVHELAELSGDSHEAQRNPGPYLEQAAKKIAQSL